MRTLSLLIMAGAAVTASAGSGQEGAGSRPAAPPASTTTTAPGAGDAAPPFSLPGSDGRTYSLESFAGSKVVVLAWFPKAFTGG